MKKIKEIIVFSEQGDPREIKTWSNVPYFLVTALETKNIIIHTVDLSVQDVFQRVIRKIYNLALFKIFKSTFLSYSVTPFYAYITNYKIKKAIKKYSNADLFIFTTFSFSASDISSKPSVLFCDWTMEYNINHFLNRRPNYLERLAIKRQNKIIEDSKGVFVLFPFVAATLKKQFSNPNIFYNGNYNNSLFESTPNIIKNKLNQNKLLFVGSKRYFKGVTDLLAAYDSLKKTHSNLELHIIGINQSDLPNHTEGIFCYGYLDKGKKEDAVKFYDLIKDARIFINTTPKWASFSASVEAMYFYTPLIITAYNDFIYTFGENINFGSYYNEDSDHLAELIDKILTDKKYEQICLNAYLAVKEHTWDNYADRLINTTNSLL